MIQNSGAVSQQFLTNLQLLQQQVAATQQQISSGSKLSQASDAPNSVGDVLQLESDLGRVQQVTSNLNLVSGEVNSAESALQTATQMLDQVASLAAQGVSNTVSAGSRSTFSQQVGQILSTMVSTSGVISASSTAAFMSPITSTGSALSSRGSVARSASIRA